MINNSKSEEGGTFDSDEKSDLSSISSQVGFVIDIFVTSLCRYDVSKNDKD